MGEPKQCELVLLQYAPDAITSEFATIGVMLLGEDGAHPPSRADGGVAQPPAAVSAASREPSTVDCLLRFTRDWRRVRCLDPDADVEMLQALEDDLRNQLAHGPLERATLLAKLQDYCSNGIRFTQPKACLAEDPAREIETLARLYLERPVGHGSSTRVSARQAIVGRMKDAFERAGIWGRMLKRIAAADYTFAGDPLKLDCGYAVDGSRPTASSMLPSTDDRQPSAVHLFHAVSLSSDVDTAKVLAFSFPQLREGIAQKERRRAELTAITEDGLDGNDPAVAFALATLQRSEIAVATVAGLPQIAARARDDLGA